MERITMHSDESNIGRVDRRAFLTFCIGLIAAMSLEDLSYAGISNPAEIKFPEGRCGGKNNMEKKVLVTYASKYGSTGGVADAIGKELCGKGMAADVALIKNAVNISSYQAVVIGSATYMGKLMPEAVNFVKKNRDILCQVPVAYFVVGATMFQPTDKNRAKALSFMDPILAAVPEIKPVDIGTFAGALDYSNLSWLNKQIMKSKGVPEGDFRDWNAIHAWAQESVYTKFVRYEAKK